VRSESAYHQGVTCRVVSSECYKFAPHKCWDPQYWLKGMQVLLRNPVDNLNLTTCTDNYGMLKASLPFSRVAYGQKLEVQLNPGSSRRSITPNMTMVHYGTGLAAERFLVPMEGSMGHMGVCVSFPATMSTGTLRGKVVSAMNNRAMNAKVHLVDVTSHKTIAQANVQKEWPERGKFEFKSVPVGLYNVKSETTDKVGSSNVGYVEAEKIVLWNQEVTLPMSPAMTGRGLRVVLGWNESPPAPKDLDLHTVFSADASGQSCHVYFGRRKCAGAELDVDNVRGGQHGSETITLTEVRRTVYTFYMHNWHGDVSGGSASTESSGAYISVYTSAGRIAETYMPPPYEADSYHGGASVPSYNGQYRDHSKYVHVLCVDARGSSPQVRTIALTQPYFIPGNSPASHWDHSLIAPDECGLLLRAAWTMRELNHPALKLHLK